VPRSIKYTPAAVRDLDAALKWLSLDAERRNAGEKSGPKSTGSPNVLFPFGPHPGLREFSCAEYRIVYRLRPDTGLNETAGDVEVLRIFGPGQAREGL
jgi:hypothetical protein